jgi:hypothetical protein
MMNSVDFRVQRNMYLLVPLGRGGRGGCSSSGGVGNGGLWWPEWSSEGDGLALLSSGLCLFLRWRGQLSSWS